ncbi:hypothetical protein MNV49_000166 [Pseudohyphozyma bogoriensis]|nr:hypothetical protein MNV49_000166 [Pseudohyphozyma bogoriensis]
MTDLCDAGDGLTSDNLDRFTQLHPASARHTVQIYLRDQRPRSYEPMTLTNSITSPPRLPSPSSHEPRDRRFVDSADRLETALVLHPVLEGPPAGKKDKIKERSSEEPAKRKVSVVAAMRPRFSSNHALSPANSKPDDAAGPSSTKRDPKRDVSDVKKEQVVEGQEAQRSSPLLVSRKERDTKPRTVVYVEIQRRSKGKEREPARSKENRSPHKRSAKVDEECGEVKRPKGKKRSGEFGSDEDEEHMARLDARRSKRQAKALIVKDRTQSARATGAAAAAKVQATSRARSSKKEKGGSEVDEAEELSEEEEHPKRKRRAAAEKATRAMQAKPANVGKSRLTIRPSNLKLGLFNKGAASARTKVGKPLPDLSFSELNFLNATRPSPPPSISSASSSTTSERAKPSATRRQKEVDTSITYGAKPRKTRQPSESFDEAPRRSPPKRTKAKPRSTKAAPKPTRTSAYDRQRGLVKSTANHHDESIDSAPSIVGDVEADSVESGHSAYSRKMKEAHEQKSPPPVSSRAPSSAVVDTSHAWQPAAFIRIPTPSIVQEEVEDCDSSSQQPEASSASSRGASNIDLNLAQTLAGNSPSPSHSRLASLSTIDRLIKACEEGHLDVSPPRKRSPERSSPFVPPKFSEAAVETIGEPQAAPSGYSGRPNADLVSYQELLGYQGAENAAITEQGFNARDRGRSVDGFVGYEVGGMDQGAAEGATWQEGVWEENFPMPQEWMQLDQRAEFAATSFYQHQQDQHQYELAVPFDATHSGIPDSSSTSSEYAGDGMELDETMGFLEPHRSLREQPVRRGMDAEMAEQMRNYWYKAQP